MQQLKQRCGLNQTLHEKGLEFLFEERCSVKTKEVAVPTCSTAERSTAAETAAGLDGRLDVQKSSPSQPEDGCAVYQSQSSGHNPQMLGHTVSTPRKSRRRHRSQRSLKSSDLPPPISVSRTKLMRLSDGISRPSSSRQLFGVKVFYMHLRAGVCVAKGFSR